MNQHRVTRVVLAGTEENLAEFRTQSPSLEDKVVGQISLDSNASPAEAWERAFEVAQAAQRQAEEEQLAQVITVAHKGGAAAIGLPDTLVALQEAGRINCSCRPTCTRPVSSACSARRSCRTCQRSARIAGANWLLRRMLSTWSFRLPSMPV